MIGNGGNGGDAGTGNTPAGLPALGGAGGNPGELIGQHGTNGAAGAIAQAGDPGLAAPAIQADNGWLTNSDGQVVIMHGLNEVYKVAPYEPSASGFSAKDAQFLEDNGFNAVRLGILWAGIEPRPGVIDYSYLANIKDTVDMLAAHHIVVILGMHQDLYSDVFGGEGAPDWATAGDLTNQHDGINIVDILDGAEFRAWDAFWDNDKAPDGVGLEDHYATDWQAVANYFKGDAGVAGYELMNEPYPGQSTFLGTLLGNPYFESQQLTPFYNQLDTAIRSVDPEKTLFFEPSILSTSLPLTTHLGTVHDPNTAYSFHQYCLTNELFSDSDLGCGFLADTMLNLAQDYAQAHNIPALMTEFGNTTYVPDITDGVNSADTHMIGWTEWAYTGHDITSASPNGQALVYDLTKPPTGDTVDTAKLDALDQPYPQQISGTPDTWSFTNGVFTMSYSTNHVDGSGAFPSGSPTTISVPTTQYPHGYTATATGATITSPPNATLLTITSTTGGATTITVTVTPKT